MTTYYAIVSSTGKFLTHNTGETHRFFTRIAAQEYLDDTVDSLLRYGYQKESNNLKESTILEIK